MRDISISGNFQKSSKTKNPPLSHFVNLQSHSSKAVSVTNNSNNSYDISDLAHSVLKLIFC